MAAQTGRTVKRWTRFIIKDSAGTLREVPIDSINGVGLDYPEVELTAFQDALKGVLPDTPSCEITITGPFDNSAAASVAASGAAPVLSGSHTVLNPIAGLSTPLSLGVYIGMRHYWETGEPVFGISSSSTSGFICLQYQADPSNGKYTAKFGMYPGSSAPAWGTAAVT